MALSPVRVRHLSCLTLRCLATNSSCFLPAVLLPVLIGVLPTSKSQTSKSKAIVDLFSSYQHYQQLRDRLVFTYAWSLHI